MKKAMFILGAFLLPLSVFASVEDTSIIDALAEQEPKQIEVDFSLQSFQSCNDMENVMWEYIKTYWKNNKNNWGYPIRWWGWEIDFMEDVMVESDAWAPEMDKSTSAWSDWDFSQTNTQVSGVDESDTVKTDGEFIYYYNESEKAVFIASLQDKKIMKKIQIPQQFSSPVLYLADNTLTIVSSWYSQSDVSQKGYWIDRNSKTYVIVYDITQKSSPVLEKLFMIDGNLTQSRRIGDYVYVISDNSFHIPYYTFQSEEDIDVSVWNILPQKTDLSKTSTPSLQNVKVKWKKIPYNIVSWNVGNCDAIEYVLPDEETLKKYDFSPSYTIISAINIKDPTQKVETKVIVGNNAEIYMSLENLYLTSHMYQAYNFSCPVGRGCFAPWYPRGANTLVHKLNIDGKNIKYQDSALVPGNPLTQYSMDEYKTDFRILTQTNNWNTNTNESHTDLYILNKDLWLKSSLKNLWNWEQFKSSRYIWDKLFLVTFKQVDPLYAIDVSDSTTPKILWELKIPGYSTYLHPYDENHLIGLWYDTKENEWWGTVNLWIKVDLYEINYDKKCSDSNLTTDEKTKCDSWEYKWIIVKQKYSKTFWGNWSSSEALSNPRMFMWKASDKKLFLPVSLYQNDATDIYRYTDFFNWLLVLSIDKSSWIKENYRITHIDTSWLEQERINECSKYTSNNTSNTCTKLINWEEYCESKVYSYVPKYCYADSTIWEYIASRSWNYYQDFIKRWLWIGDNSYAVSNSYVSANNISTWKEVFKLKLK